MTQYWNFVAWFGHFNSTLFIQKYHLRIKALGGPWSDSAWSISVWLNHHNISHSSMSGAPSAALLSMAPLLPLSPQKQAECSSAAALPPSVSASFFFLFLFTPQTTVLVDGPVCRMKEQESKWPPVSESEGGGNKAENKGIKMEWGCGGRGQMGRFERQKKTKHVWVVGGGGWQNMAKGKYGDYRFFVFPFHFLLTPTGQSRSFPPDTVNTWLLCGICFFFFF